MNYLKILVFIAVILFLVYVILTLGQLFGLWKYTEKKITFKGLLIPFYYWFNL